MSRAVRIGLGIVVLAALVVAGRLLPIGTWLAQVESWVRGLGPWGAVVFGFIYVAAALAFVPGSVVTLAAGAIFGAWWGTVIVSMASTTAAALAFLIARYLAREWVEGLAKRDARFAAIDQAIREGGWKIVALLRLSPVVPFSLSNYLYGLTPVAFGPYVLASWVAMFPATVLYVSIGAAGRAAAGGSRRPIEWVFIGIGVAATLVATVMITRAAQKRLAKVRGAAAG
jgi:uncharacterized membrane protein YdjX (TVP38/TMEM64 family)